MPAPEQLGVGASHRSQEVDWAAVRRRLEALSATSFHLQKAPAGFRFTCLVPAPGGQRRKIDADGVTEAEAIDQALEIAEVNARR